MYNVCSKYEYRYIYIMMCKHDLLVDYCHWETFNATCGHNSVIVMTHAQYGRMNTGRCITKEIGYVGCQEVSQHSDDIL